MSVHPAFRLTFVVERALGTCAAIVLAFLEAVPIISTYFGPAVTSLSDVQVPAWVILAFTNG